MLQQTLHESRQRASGGPLEHDQDIILSRGRGHGSLRLAAHESKSECQIPHARGVNRAVDVRSGVATEPVREPGR